MLFMMSDVLEIIDKNFDEINLVDEENHSNFQEKLDDCEEATTTDSEEFLSDNLGRYNEAFKSTSTDVSNTTLTQQLSEEKEIFTHNEICQGISNIQIPIVGYEVMEERARFTVYKMRIENKASGDCWYVFRRYTDFVRLCNRLKYKLPHVFQYLPRKRWLRNNFDQVFLEERRHGLQKLINMLLKEINLDDCILIQDFFCLNEPPVYSEANEESRAIFEALEETIYQLKQELKTKDNLIEDLKMELTVKDLEIENLKR